MQMQQLCKRCQKVAPTPGKDWCYNCYLEYNGGVAPKQKSQAPPVQVSSQVRCANPRCPCDSWNGKAGEFCCRACRQGQSCPTRQHLFSPVSAAGYCMMCNATPQLMPALPICAPCGAKRLEQYKSLVKTMECVKFYDRDKPFYEFTNFWPVQIRGWDGKDYPTSEHLFQAAKFQQVRDDVAEMIRTSQNPRQAFDLAHQYVQFERANWLGMRDDAMRMCLKYKFENPYLREVLLCTQGLPIIEHTVNDKYWADAGDGTGRNMLGTLLVELRDTLLQQQQQQPNPQVAASPPQGAGLMPPPQVGLAAPQAYQMHQSPVFPPQQAMNSPHITTLPPQPYSTAPQLQGQSQPSYVTAPQVSPHVGQPQVWNAQGQLMQQSSGGNFGVQGMQIDAVGHTSQSAAVLPIKPQ